MRNLPVTKSFPGTHYKEVLKLRRRVLQAHGTAPARVGPAANVRVSPHRSASAGRGKLGILRAVDRAREHLPLRALLRFLRVSPSRFHAWSRRQRACVLDDQSSCPRLSPSRLTPSEVRAIKDLVTLPEYRHVPTDCPHRTATGLYIRGCNAENGESHVARVDRQNSAREQSRCAFQLVAACLTRARAGKCRMSAEIAPLCLTRLSSAA
jgi:hypothetical protein